MATTSEMDIMLEEYAKALFGLRQQYEQYRAYVQRLQSDASNLSTTLPDVKTDVGLLKDGATYDEYVKARLVKLDAERVELTTFFGTAYAGMPVLT